MRTIVWNLLLGGVVAACLQLLAGQAVTAAEAEAWPSLKPAMEAIPNVRVVSPALVRGGQPSEEGLKLLKEAGVKTIVNLRNEEVLVAREERIARQLGLKFVNIPQDAFNQPAESDIRKFLSTVDESANQPVFVHCLYGQDRTGTMVGIYRIKYQGWTASQAFDEMVSCGFKPGLANLTRAVYGYAASNGRPEKMPGADVIVRDLKRRIQARLNGGE
jgi:protein tyrosine/serine phosphatase